jgi:hypothetical protein
MYIRRALTAIWSYWKNQFLDVLSLEITYAVELADVSFYLVHPIFNLRSIFYSPVEIPL